MKINMLAAIAVLTVLCGSARGSVAYETPSAGEAWSSRAICSGVAICALRSTEAESLAIASFDSRPFALALSDYIIPFSSMTPGFLLFFR